MKVSLLDSREKRLETDINIKIDAWLPCNYVLDGIDYGFYYKGSDGIYGYDIESSEYRLLCLLYDQS